MIKSYAIYQPVDAPIHSPELLIKHALKAIFNEAQDTPIRLSRFDLVQPYSSTGLPGIQYEFSDLTDENRMLRNQNVEGAKRQKNSLPTTDLEYIGDNDNSSKLRGLIIRLPQGERQYDGLLLVDKLADTIKKLGKIDIYDFVYHEHIDEDAIEQPYFTLYYCK